MLQLFKCQKRPIHLGVFFAICSLIACTPQTESDTAQSSAQNAVEEQSFLPALISMQQLLNTTDFKQALKTAVQNGDDQSIKRWQSKLIEVAKEARMSASDIEMLTGMGGFTYLEFHGKRLNYNDEFISRLVNFEDLQPLFEKYPHFQKLHAVSKKMQQQRDDLIQKRVIELSQQAVEGDINQIATAEWKDYFINATQD